MRISPFDAEKMRHTSFALVEVLPELPDTAAVEIDPKIYGLILLCQAAWWAVGEHYIFCGVDCTFRPALLCNVRMNVRKCKTKNKP